MVASCESSRCYNFAPRFILGMRLSANKAHRRNEELVLTPKKLNSWIWRCVFKGSIITYPNRRSIGQSSSAAELLFESGKVVQLYESLILLLDNLNTCFCTHKVKHYICCTSNDFSNSGPCLKKMRVLSGQFWCTPQPLTSR